MWTRDLLKLILICHEILVKMLLGAVGNNIVGGIKTLSSGRVKKHRIKISQVF